jgi:hypothetical protein
MDRGNDGSEQSGAADNGEDPHAEDPGLSDTPRVGYIEVVRGEVLAELEHAGGTEASGRRIGNIADAMKPTTAAEFAEQARAHYVLFSLWERPEPEPANLEVALTRIANASGNQEGRVVQSIVGANEAIRAEPPRHELARYLHDFNDRRITAELAAWE